MHHRQTSEVAITSAPRPVVTVALVALNLAVFAVLAANGAGWVKSNAAVVLDWGANFAPLTTQGEPWRLATSLFLHFGLAHLAFNMWALYDSGRLVERLYGHTAFLILYLTAGVAGSIGSLLWRQDAVSAGASGAVFGVYGALLAYLAIHHRGVAKPVLRGLLASSLFFVGFSLFYGYSQTGIDNAAHVGGLLGGFAVGLPLAWPRAGRRRFVAAATTALLLVAAWSAVPPVGYSYARERAFHAELHWFAQEETDIMGGLRDRIGQYEAGRLGERELLRGIEQETLPRWRAAHDRLARIELDERSPSRERRRRLLEYAGLRRDAVSALMEGVRDRDRAKIERFEALKLAGDRVLEEMENRRAPRAQER